METLIDGFNDFSLDLLQNIQYHQPAAQNVVFSSYSLVLALLMALAGSNKDTKTEMIKTLRVDNYLGTNYSNYNNLDKFFKNLNKNLISYYDSTPSGSMNNKLIIANKVLVNDIEIRNSYHKLIEKTFNTKINMANGSFKKVIDDTNKWIENITNNKIKNLLDDSFQISSLVLINVIYFKYNWLNKFNKRFTQTDQNFYLNPSRTEMSKVDMMNVYRKRLPYSYLQSIDSHLVKLPYENKRYYFNVILPYNEDDFLDKNDKLSIINKINLDELKRGLFEEDYTRFISLKMPKFKIKAKFEFSPLLKELGIVDAFDRKNADFSAINGKNDLYIDKVIQHAFIEVNEQGTEAAAATAIRIMRRSLVFAQRINLNRPFIFLITDNSNGLILFSGIFRGQK